MRVFRALPIKRQLMLIIMLTSGLVLLLACAAFVAYDQYVFRQTMVRDLSTLAVMTGKNTAAALSIDRPSEAENTLAFLNTVNQVMTACIYRSDGTILAMYPSGLSAQRFPQMPAQDTQRFEPDSLIVFRSIAWQGQKVGVIYLQSSLNELQARLRLFSTTVAVIVAVAFGVVFLLSSKFQALISEPLLELARTARAVSDQKNYSVRAVKRTEGEIGFVTDQFNEMLAEIEKRDEELKAVMAQLRESEHRAQVATQAKSQFLANMSHELRTPLNAIIGFSEILSDRTFGDLNDKQARHVNNILTSGRHLLQLINDLLDLAKIEAGKVLLERAEFDVAKALHDVQSIVAMLAHKKKITFNVEAPADVPPLFADQPKFKQVMYNLLSNAIKFTPEGGQVTVQARVERCGDAGAREQGSRGEKEKGRRGEGEKGEDKKERRGEEEKGRKGAGEPVSSIQEPASGIQSTLNPQPSTSNLHVSVSDSGIGIKPEDHARVFQEFEQVDSSYARQQHGTGLGLSLTRKLVEMHGGRIWVESEGIEGKGTTFTFSIPLVTRQESSKTERIERAASERGALDRQRQGASARDDGPLVLVVEDDRQAGELMEDFLMAGGYRVAHAWDGEQGVQMARKLQPQAITLDILLPRMNGWEVLAELKGTAETKDIPVVIVSVTSDQQLGFSLGAIEYFVKPVSKDLLLDAVRKAALATGRVVQTVLVVDDEPMTVEFLSTAVSGAGYKVVEAFGGRQGIELALANRPDLIILDLIMPEVSGFDVVQRLRQDPKTKDTPILIYTAKNLTDEDRRQLRDRVQAITSKSSKEELLRELDRLSGRGGGRGKRGGRGEWVNG